MITIPRPHEEPKMSHYVYVLARERNRVLVFSMAPDSGRLTLRSEAGLDGSPYTGCFSPAQDTLYVTITIDRQPFVSCFSVAQQTGGLTPIGTLPMEADPCYLSVDNTGRFLFAAYYLAGMVTVHARNADGTINETVVGQYKTEKYAHFIKTDATNRYAFVPHVESANAIYQFLFDQDTGKLTPNAVPKVDAGPGQGPRHLGFHPTLDVVYADNEQECSVTVYGFDKSKGTVTALQTVSTLPDEGYDGDKSNAQLHLHPQSRAVYASNRGPDSIAMFAIDPDTGLITSLGQQPGVKIPRAFGIDPDGDYMYAGGDASPLLVTYRIDHRGALHALDDTYEVGTSTGWVLPVKFS